MKPDAPSRTAHFVALGRAHAHAGISHVPGFHDPTALVFLNDKGKKSFAKTQRAVREGKRGFMMRMALSMGDMIALRTSAIDAAVGDAIAGGATQLVILGAGYDGRAWRMPELAGVTVFEVDRAGTQLDKRARVTELPQPIGNVKFVETDFERDSLDNILARAGHDAAAKTCWIWEGVVMYLTRDAVHATLADVAKRSAPGSTLIVNYHTEHRRLLMRLIFKLIGEPQISAWTPAEMKADLGRHGLVVQEDTGMMDWNGRFANGAADVQRGAYMRIAVGEFSSDRVIRI